MRLKAYLLAADPTWIEASVLSYYDLVDEIIVSFDENRIGYTGVPVPVDECLKRLEAIDRDRKMRHCPGHYARLDHTPMENETYQRQCAIEESSEDADWVLQLDPDEILPRPDTLAAVLQHAEAHDIRVVEWPMRVLFRQVANSRFLEVCGSEGSAHFEYPGSIAVRPEVILKEGRRADETYIRPVVKGDVSSLQVRRDAEPGEIRMFLEDPEAAIMHFSWARPSSQIRTKIATWSHSAGWRSWLYYYFIWSPTPYLWRWTHDFHPFERGLWPELKSVVIDIKTTPLLQSAAAR